MSDVPYYEVKRDDGLEFYTYDWVDWYLVRPKSHSDILVVNEVMRADEYHLADVRVRMGVVIDVGMNIGAFSMWAIRHGAKRVIAYEPEPDNFRVARANFDLHAVEVEAHQMAVWRDDQGVDMLADDGNTVTADLGIYSPARVPSVTLNQILSEHQRVSFLKMDIEGAELAVIQAADPEQLRKVDRIAMEYHGQTDDWGAMVRHLSGVFDLTILGHNSPHENSGGMMHGVRRP